MTSVNYTKLQAYPNINLAAIMNRLQSFTVLLRWGLVMMRLLCSAFCLFLYP